MRKPGAKALVIYDGKFVLVQRDNKPDILNPNKWNLPGGGMEEGESPKETLLRELEEEIGISPSPDAPEDMGTTTYQDGSAVVHRFAVRVTHSERDTVHLVSEGQQLGWFTLDDALDLDLSAHLRAYFVDCYDDIQSTLNGKTVTRNYICTTPVSG